MKSKLDFLKKNAHLLYDVYMNGEEHFDITVIDDVELKHGEKNIQYHSKKDIESEFELTCRNISESDEIIILFGIGNGKILKYISDKFKYIKRVIVIEPSVSIYRWVLENLSLDEMFGLNYDVSFLVNKSYQEMENIVQYSLLENSTSIRILKISAENLLFKDYFGVIEQNIVEHIHRKRVNFATREFWKVAWIKNVLYNLSLNESNIITEDNNGLEGKTVFIVGAGPSMDIDVHKLKLYKDEGYIFSVGTGSRILHVNDVKSDYRFVIDGYQVLRNLTDEEEDNGLPIVYSNKVNFNLMDKFKGEKYEMVLDLDYIAKFTYDLMDVNYKEIRSAFTVAQVAIDLAAKMGAKRIVLLGMDCAYTDRRLHAANDGEELQESVNVNMTFEEEQFIKTVDKYGEEIYTDIALLGTKRITEELIIEYPDVEFINAGTGGLTLEGAADVSLEQLFSANKSSGINKEDIFSSVHVSSQDKISSFSEVFEFEFKKYLAIEEKLSEDNSNSEDDTIEMIYDYLSEVQKSEFYHHVLRYVINSDYVVNYYMVKLKKKNRLEDLLNQITIIGEIMHIMSICLNNL